MAPHVTGWCRLSMLNPFACLLWHRSHAATLREQESEERWAVRLEISLTTIPNSVIATACTLF